MKRFLIGLAMAGLLLSAPAFAQNNDQDTKDKPASTTSDTNVKVNGDAGRLQNDRTKQNNVKASSETREHRGDRGRMSTTTRTTVGVHVRDREVRVRHRRCRTVVIKKRYHHRVVVRHIRRCF